MQERHDEKKSNMSQLTYTRETRDKTIETIAVAIDLSQDNRIVLDAARHLSSTHDANVVLIHVADSVDLSDRANDATISEADLRRRVHSELRERIGELAGKTGFARDPRLVVEFGLPHRFVLKSVRDLNADLLIIGPGRPSSLRERVFGSTADHIVRTSAIPVLVARKHSIKPYRHVAVAVDFSEHSEGALRAAMRLAPMASLELVHSVDIPLQFEQAMLRAGPSGGDPLQFRAARIADARKHLAEVAAVHALSRRRHISVLQGSPAHTLIQLSQSGRFDLLALGTRGRDAVTQALLGSVARRVVAEAACDVLITSRHSLIGSI